MPAPEEEYVCGVCGHPLNYREIRGGESRFEHALGEQMADHDPEPVPQSQAVVVADRCDFCYADHPQWVVPARSFMLMAGHNSGGDWAACDECAPLIERDQWSALARRAKEGWEERHGVPMPGPVADNLSRMYRLLRRNITGSLKPNPALNRPGSKAGRFGTGWKSRNLPGS